MEASLQLSMAKCQVWERSYLGPYKPAQTPAEYHQVTPGERRWSKSSSTQPIPAWIPDPQNCKTLIKWLLFEAIKFQNSS